jgi:hypothetical protein
VAVGRFHHDVDVLNERPAASTPAQIHTLIDSCVRRDKAVLLVSSYLPSCSASATGLRMSRGRPARQPVEAWTEHSLLMEASGARAS